MVWLKFVTRVEYTVDKFTTTNLISRLPTLPRKFDYCDGYNLQKKSLRIAVLVFLLAHSLCFGTLCRAPILENKYFNVNEINEP